MTYFDSIDDDETAFAWNLIKNATEKGYMIGADCMDLSRKQDDWGLPCGHAYSVLGTYSGKNKKGETINLIRVRNPWSSDAYKGPWSDDSSLWNTIDWKAAGIPYVNNTKDGDFFVQDIDFVELYAYVEIAPYSKNKQVFFTESLNDDGKKKTYDMTLEEDAVINLDV